MRVVVVAVGRMRRTAEADLIRRYLDRAGKSGRPAALTDFQLVEIDESRARHADARKAEEAARLRATSPDDCRTVVLDERGNSLTSRKLAQRIAGWRDGGTGSIAFLIGGPDGHDARLRSAADLVLSLGSMTMPHLLARAVLCEQLYRATTILTGHPYHRD